MRFSAPIQQYGDSLRRQNQLIDEWIAQNPEYELDNLTYQDLGLSAFNGINALRGALSDFLDAIEHGFIKKGTVLLVESLDRLSREKIGDSTERLRHILKAGVEVVTLSDRMHYNEESLDDPYVLIKAILIAQRANEESEIKSKRMRSVWQKKREDAEKNGKLLTRSCPRWLKATEDGGGFEVLPQHAKTIKYIFKLRLKGHSLNGITKILNDKKTQTLTGNSGVWNPSTIEKILGNKAVTGTYCPSYRTMSKGVKNIDNYYPRIISYKIFQDVQEIRLTPFGRDKTYDNPYLINLFRSILRCSSCGCSIIMTGIDNKGMGYYVCPMRRLHRCSTPPIRRDFTDQVLVGVLLANMDFLQDSFSGKNAIKQLEHYLVDVHIKINHLLDALQIAPDVMELSNRVRLLSKELRDGELRLRTLKSRGGNTTGEMVASMELDNKINREKCRNYALSNIEQIIIDTAMQKCDIHLMNGLRILNFPLRKIIHHDNFISSLAFIDNNTLIF
ncbi:recombinase family protein [Citrobacter youngae]|uniref:recombinase family protein n=1 Tax=Citrobacter TaxID=544 RepID=UPI002A3687D2|nr:recombinase family protein [Citrobacter youngae]